MLAHASGAGADSGSRVQQCANLGSYGTQRPGGPPQDWWAGPGLQQRGVGQSFLPDSSQVDPVQGPRAGSSSQQQVPGVSALMSHEPPVGMQLPCAPQSTPTQGSAGAGSGVGSGGGGAMQVRELPLKWPELSHVYSRRSTLVALPPVQPTSQVAVHDSSYSFCPLQPEECGGDGAGPQLTFSHVGPLPV